MSLTVSKISPNPHIVALETVLSQAIQPIECLVIAHNDPKMLSALRTALDGESAVVLELSQDLWDFEGNQLPEAIEWVLEQTDLKQLVLVGHTLVGGPQSQAFLAASESTHSQYDSYQKLINGVHLNNARIRAAQDRFALQVQQVLHFPMVSSRCSAGELSVHGLLYRAESGLFLAYDANQDGFYPLVA